MYIVPRRVKLKLEQPTVMCAGRARVSWYGKGTVVAETVAYMIVQLRYKGKELELVYDKDFGEFTTSAHKDIKIITK